MSKIKRIQALVPNGLYYLTEHPYDEASADDLDIYDVEQGILTGKMRIERSVCRCIRLSLRNRPPTAPNYALKPTTKRMSVFAGPKESSWRLVAA